MLLAMLLICVSNSPFSFASFFMTLCRFLLPKFICLQKKNNNSIEYRSVGDKRHLEVSSHVFKSQKQPTSPKNLLLWWSVLLLKHTVPFSLTSCMSGSTTLCLEEVILENHIALLDPSSLQDSLPWDFYKQIHKQVRICSSQGQGCYPAICFLPSSKAAEPLYFVFTATRAAPDIHIQFFLVSKYQVQQNTFLQCFYHQCQEVIRIPFRASGLLLPFQWIPGCFKTPINFMPTVFSRFLFWSLFKYTAETFSTGTTTTKKAQPSSKQINKKNTKRKNKKPRAVSDLFLSIWSLWQFFGSRGCKNGLCEKRRGATSLLDTIPANPAMDTTTGHS